MNNRPLRVILPFSFASELEIQTNGQLGKYIHVWFALS